MDHPPRIALTIDKFAKSAGIGRTQVYLEIKAGRLRPLKLGKRTLVPVGEAAAWLERLATSHAPKSATIRDGMPPSSSVKGQTA